MVWNEQTLALFLALGGDPVVMFGAPAGLSLSLLFAWVNANPNKNWIIEQIELYIAANQGGGS